MLEEADLFLGSVERYCEWARKKAEGLDGLAWYVFVNSAVQLAGQVRDFIDEEIAAL